MTKENSHMKNSWYMNVDGIHHFFCQCGTHDIVENIVQNQDFEISKFDLDKIAFIPNLYYPDNICSRCNNEHYLDRDALLFENKTRYWTKLVFDYKEEIDDRGCFVSAILTIPEYDKVSCQFYYKTINILKYRLDYNGQEDTSFDTSKLLRKKIKLKDDYIQIEFYLKKELDKRLIKLIFNPYNSKRLYSSLLKSSKRDISKDMLVFFLKNSRLNFIDIFFWRGREVFIAKAEEEKSLEKTLAYIINYRREKTIRKAHYQSYSQQMQQGGYNPLFEYIFSRAIKDHNHLLRLLVLPTKIKQNFFQSNSIESIHSFISFLQKFYSEKALVNFWIKIANDMLDNFYLEDTINLFRDKDTAEELSSMFIKTSLNIKVIHDQLVEHYGIIQADKLDNEQINYSDTILKSEVEYDGFVYALPKDKKELYRYGEILHNCIYSYHSHIVSGVSTLFMVFINHKLQYAIEIQNNKIVQLSGAYNKPIKESHRHKIDGWFRDIFLRNYIDGYSSII